MKRILISIILFSIFLTGCSSGNDNNETKFKNQQYMIQATTQRVLKNYKINTKTSSSLEDWNISSQSYNNTIRWTATTNDNDNKRIKCIFEWSGNDQDDLILVYLLYGGQELINDL